MGYGLGPGAVLVRRKVFGLLWGYGYGAEGGAEPGAGEAGEEGTVGGFFCGVGCGGVELRAGGVGGVRLGKEGVEGRVGEGGGGEQIVPALCRRVLWGVR